MWRRVTLVRTDISEELIRVKWISELGTTLTVTSTEALVFVSQNTTLDSPSFAEPEGYESIPNSLTFHLRSILMLCSPASPLFARWPLLFKFCNCICSANRVPLPFHCFTLPSTFCVAPVGCSPQSLGWHLCPYSWTVTLFARGTTEMLSSRLKCTCV
jgi:hypothetical protein